MSLSISTVKALILDHIGGKKILPDVNVLTGATPTIKQVEAIGGDIIADAMSTIPLPFGRFSATSAQTLRGIIDAIDENTVVEDVIADITLEPLEAFKNLVNAAIDDVRGQNPTWYDSLRVLLIGMIDDISTPSNKSLLDILAGRVAQDPDAPFVYKTALELDADMPAMVEALDHEEARSVAAPYYAVTDLDFSVGHALSQYASGVYLHTVKDLIDSGLYPSITKPPTTAEIQSFIAAWKAEHFPTTGDSASLKVKKAQQRVATKMQVFEAVKSACSGGTGAPGANALAAAAGPALKATIESVAQAQADLELKNADALIAEFLDSAAAAGASYPLVAGAVKERFTDGGLV